MRRLRVQPSVVEQFPPSRAALLQAITFEEHPQYAVATVAGEPLFQLGTLAAVCEAMKLAVGDLEPLD